jgi:hypothetical protein
VLNEERRARLAVHHGLAPGHRATDVTSLAGAFCGLHATDPVSVYLAPWARIDGFVPVDLERALYDERTAVRMLGMRRTVFVLPTELAGVVHQSCTVKVAATNRRRLTRLIEDEGVAADGREWLAEAEREVLTVLAQRGEALATELSDAVPSLRIKVGAAEGKAYGAPVALNNQVLTHLAAEGRIVRGRPRGAWTTNQYRWAPIERWVSTPLDAVAPADADAELARRWLASFGPARTTDLQWWAGWTASQTRAALSAIGAVAVQLEDGGHAWLSADDVEPVGPREPWVALLPALDPTAMGWQERSWYLGPHKAALFDRTGNIGPTVWADGRIVGGWVQRADGEIVHRLLEDVGAELNGAIAAKAAALQGWLGAVRFKPKFRTPLELELFAG